MLDTVLDAVCATLEAQGICAFCEYPEGYADFKSGAFVCVGVENCRCLSSGMGDYLGVRTDASGVQAQLFGRRLELVLGLEIFSPFGKAFGARACRACADELRACIPMLPSGIRSAELSSGEVFADGELLAYRQSCKLSCTAFLVAEGGDDGGEFLDFVLKGTIKNGY